MAIDKDWRDTAATLTAALIARMPPDAKVTPADAVALFEQIGKLLAETNKASAARVGGLSI